MDLAHPAATEQLLDAVARDVRAGGRCRCVIALLPGASLPDRGRDCKRGRGRAGAQQAGRRAALAVAVRRDALPPCNVRLPT